MFLRAPGRPWDTAFYGDKKLTKKASTAAALTGVTLLLRVFTCSRPALARRILRRQNAHQNALYRCSPDGCERMQNSGYATRSRHAGGAEFLYWATDLTPRNKSQSCGDSNRRRESRIWPDVCSNIIDIICSNIIDTPDYDGEVQTALPYIP